jgi:alkylation response protein AidB-like acyl-CoA dehydrogenase
MNTCETSKVEQPRHTIPASGSVLIATRRRVPGFDRAIQIHGGLGRLMESGFGQLYCAARIAQIAEGSRGHEAPKFPLVPVWAIVLKRLEKQ